MQIDKEYEEAIRFFLDTSLKIPENTEDTLEELVLNIAKPFTSYIKKASKEKENYLFDTPVYGWWNVTSACNFRCIHCLYNDTEYASKNDLSHEQSMNLIDELVNDFGVVQMLLTGGEIFTRSDIMDIIRKFKENNVVLKLLTNASLLKDSQISELAELLNPYTDMITISLDGATNETFKKIRQTDTFEKIKSNIKKLVEHNINVSTACTVNTVNYNEVLDTYKLSANLGVKYFSAGKIIVHNESHTNLAVPDRDLFLLHKKLMQNEVKGTKMFPLFHSPMDILNKEECRKILEEEKYQGLLNKYRQKVLSRTCHCHDRFAIQSDGRIYLCLSAAAEDVEALGSYKEKSLLEVWENRKNNKLFQPRVIENMVCNKCRYNKYCNSGCVVKSYLRTKDINSPQIPCQGWQH